jgi:hypothetical protein
LVWHRTRPNWKNIGAARQFRTREGVDHGESFVRADECFAHQGAQLFATWYTYDAKVVSDNAPLWFSALMTQGAGNVFTGSIFRTPGPRFDNYKTSDVVQPATMVGNATLTFTDGNHASFR